MDRFSPVASAHIRVLVLPVGQLERSRFIDFLHRLWSEAAVVQLSELQQYGGDEEFSLSPKEHPQGCLLYNYTTSPPSEQQQQLAPYELFREALLVVGVVGGLSEDVEEGQREIAAAAAYLRERHPRFVHRQLLLLTEEEDAANPDTEVAISVTNAGLVGNDALRAAVGRLSVRFLREFTTYTKAMQASPSIQTPGQTARSLQKMSWLRDSEERPRSGYATPTHEVTSPAGDEPQAQSRPPSRQHGSPAPATSFDQMPGASSVPSALARSDSQTSSQSKNGRATSHDRASVQGFGQLTSKDKAKTRGKARVGIVLGSIYMMAGQWSEALRMLSEHTNKARTLSDNLWHAKGLELIVVCMLLLASAGLDFQIPSICYPIAERATSGHVARFSVNLPTDFRPAEAARQASMRRLANSLPDLLKQILHWYRSGEGSLELPFNVVSEATVRFSKLLAILYTANGELSVKAFSLIIPVDLSQDDGTGVAGSSPDQASSTQSASPNLSKGAIADLLAAAQPESDDPVAASDHISILAGTASVYGLLQMSRKKAITVKDLVARLTTALNQARKLGAADMGIHPAASLLADTGADTLRAAAEDSAGLQAMMLEVGRIYGVEMSEDADGEIPANSSLLRIDSTAFGIETLKLDVMREMVAYCEASPDLSGLVKLAALLLRSARLQGALDAESEATGLALSKDEQVRLVTTINRTVSIAKQVGYSSKQARYWDPFLVRSIALIPPDANLALLDRSKVAPMTTSAQQETPGNPLLYDPNARLAATAQQTPVLVQGETSDCAVTLQNPYDINVEIESLGLVTEGVKLETSHQAIAIGPSRIQQVSLSVSPCSVGETKITACRVKLAGCEEEVFPIVDQAWRAKHPFLVKEQGQDALGAEADPKQKASEPETVTLTAIAIMSQPVLTLESTTLLDATTMLLEGEQLDFGITVRNGSEVPACIMELVGSVDSLSFTDATQGSLTIEARRSATFKCRLIAKAGMSDFLANIFYSNEVGTSDTVYARVLSVPVKVTVNAALQVQHLDVVSLGTAGDNSLLASFELGNAWPQSIRYSCNSLVASSWRLSEEGQLAPGEVQRVHVEIERWKDASDQSAKLEDLRKALLEHLRVTWTIDARQGAVDLSGLSMSNETFERIRGDSVEVLITLGGVTGSTDPAAGKAPNLAKVGHFKTIQVKLINHARRTSPLYVQLRARIADTPASHDDRRAVVAGAMHRLIPPLHEVGHTTFDFAVCPLLSGLIDLDATVKPAILSDGTTEQAQWSTRQPFIINAIA